MLLSDCSVLPVPYGNNDGDGDATLLSNGILLEGTSCVVVHGATASSVMTIGFHDFNVVLSRSCGSRQVPATGKLLACALLAPLRLFQHPDTCA